MAKSPTKGTGTTRKASGSTKKGPPTGVQRTADQGTKGTGSAGVAPTGDAGTKGTSSAGGRVVTKPRGAKRSPR